MQSTFTLHACTLSPTTKNNTRKTWPTQMYYLAHANVLGALRYHNFREIWEVTSLVGPKYGCWTLAGQ